MRGSLIVCIAIFCLSHASGAPTDEEGKTFIKSYTFDKGEEVINTLTPFWKDEIVYAVCEGSNTDKKCKVYLESIGSVRLCNLNLNYTDRFDRSVILFNAGNSKAIFAVRDDETKVKLISVDLKGCQIKEASLEVALPTDELVLFLMTVYIVPHEKNYDVFYPNVHLCKVNLCKATYDYEGNVVKAPSIFPAVFDDFYRIEYASNAYLVARIVAGESATVYLVKDEDNQLTYTSFSANTTSVSFFIGLSFEENKIGFCSHSDNKVKCKQYDVEGKGKNIAIEIPFDYSRRAFHYLDMLNLEKGLLELSVNRKNIISVTHFDEEGKQGNTVEVDPKCNNDYAVFAKLYKDTNGQYCVNSICMAAYDARDRSKFSRYHKCFLKDELV